MFSAFEESLRKTLDEGDVDDINEKLSPKALTKCDTNALLMAMEVSLKKVFLTARFSSDLRYILAFIRCP